jgi:hypothetical protein
VSRPAEPARRRRWPLVLLALALVVALSALALIVMSSTVRVQDGVAPAQARAALDQALAAHAGPPRAELQLVDGRWRASLRPDAPPAGGEAPGRVGALLWDPAAGRLVEASAPLWAVSTASWKARTLGFGKTPLERRLGVSLDVPASLLDARGLLLDHEFPDGRRLLVWAE